MGIFPVGERNAFHCLSPAGEKPQWLKRALSQGCWVIYYHSVSVWPRPQGMVGGCRRCPRLPGSVFPAVCLDLPPRAAPTSTLISTGQTPSVLHSGEQRAQGRQVSPYTRAQPKPLTLQPLPRGSHGETEAWEKSSTTDSRWDNTELGLRVGLSPSLHRQPWGCTGSTGRGWGRWQDQQGITAPRPSAHQNPTQLMPLLRTVGPEANREQTLGHPRGRRGWRVCTLPNAAHSASLRG